MLAWNPPAWSLSAEAFFYLMFPLVAPSIVKLSRRKLAVAALMCWLVSLAGPAALLIQPGFDRNFWMFDPLIRLPEFLLGIMLGKYWMLRQPGKIDRYSPYAVIASAGLLLLFLSIDAPDSVFMNGATAPLMMALIYCLACGRSIVGRFLATRPMVMLGEASYSLYILHWPLWFIITYYLVHYLEKFQKGPAHFLVCASVMLVVSLLSYRFIEKPANAFLKQALLLSGKSGNSCITPALVEDCSRADRPLQLTDGAWRGRAAGLPSATRRY